MYKDIPSLHVAGSVKGVTFLCGSKPLGSNSEACSVEQLQTSRMLLHVNKFIEKFPLLNLTWVRTKAHTIC